MPWSRISGQDVEAVLGVLLCREFPTATRVKPSQGDGGIDVFISSERALTIYQIKSYTGNLTTARKRHITKSWNRLLAHARDNQLDIMAWHLVMPENPTKEQLKWLQGLGKDASFPLYWDGLDFVDGLAAKYPDVIDYYFDDGKERLQHVVEKFLAAAGLGGRLASPSTATSVMLDLHESLNTFDPHYRYDFAVDAIGPDGQYPRITETPGMVLGVQAGDAQRCVTVKVIARYAGATIDRPVPARLTLVAECGSALEQQIDDFMTFGTALRDVPAQDVFVDAPGGFGASAENALISIGPAKPPESPIETTIRIVHDGVMMSSLDFVAEEASIGQGMTGLRSAGRDLALGIVHYDLRIHTVNRAASINLQMGDLVGHAPAAVLPCLRFIADVRPPHLAELRIRNGPALGQTFPDRWNDNRRARRKSAYTRLRSPGRSPTPPV